MVRRLFFVAIASLFSFTWPISTKAHHVLTHDEFVLKEQSKISVRLFVCKSKEDADSALIANEQGGLDAAKRQTLYLMDALDKDGNPRCSIVSGLVTPLLVLRRTTITVMRGGIPTETEGTLMQVWVVDDTTSEIYFSPTSARVVTGGYGV